MSDAEREQEQRPNTKPASIRKDGSARIAGSDDWLVRCPGCGARVRDSWLGQCPGCRRGLCPDCLPQEERDAAKPCLCCVPARERPSVAARRILREIQASGGTGQFVRPEDPVKKVNAE